MAHRVTIHDISKESGVSQSTVSRVLTGSAYVSQEKRKAVEQAVQHLNYRPNHLARSLKTSITNSIGLLLNDITNPFYSAIVRGVEGEANRHGYTLILCNTDENSDRELQYIQVLQDKQVDGIILGPTDKNTDYIRALATQIPLVQVDRYTHFTDIAAVVVDNEGGAYSATRLLIEKGHRRIGVLKWQREITTTVERYAGYKRALDEAGIAIDPSVIITVPNLVPEQITERVQPLFEKDTCPTAVFALNNRLGLGVIGAIQRAGLKMPDDIALIVFDDLATFSLFTPALTAVRQPAFTIGERAMQMLMKQINTPNEFEPEIVVLPTELIVRASV